jgi:hypothetical protein
MRTRTLEQAHAILREEGAVSWIGETDPEKLGCYPDEQEKYLTTAPDAELRGWARSVAGDEHQ